MPSLHLRRTSPWRAIIAAAMLIVASAPLFAGPMIQAPGSVPNTQAGSSNITIPPPPPAGFNPLGASDTELAFHGVPPRPDASKNPEAYSHWSKLVSGTKNRITPILRQTNIYHKPAQNLSIADKTAVKPDSSPSTALNATSITSTNWSGYANYVASGTFLGNNSFVFAEWTVPFAQQAFGTCAGNWEYSAQWVGFDGFNSADVLQAGSEADAFCSGGSKSQYYGLWIEWYPLPEVAISNFPINPGDLIGVEVWYSSSSPHGHAYLVDLTTQQVTVIGFNPPSGTIFKGTSVEWVVEAPTVGSSQSALINYTATPWNDIYGHSTTNGSYYGPNYAPSGTAYDILMTSGGSTISYCLLYSGNSFALWCYPSGSAV
jgi:hypothetical protein